ncbi:MAG: hypothetical protein NT062_30185, partial [Proteobacteria bacterium]|nr:hypothetical protein [Pseudomonadota bacterium]
MQVPDLIRPFIERLERLGVPYMVTGSTAGILYGEPRMTHDVDIVIALGLKDVDAFVAAFPIDDFYCPPDDVLAIEVRRGQRGHCNLIHHATGFKADVYIAYDALHRWALAHRRTIELDGMKISVAPVEYVIVRKLEYYREGGSEKHLRDIRGMLAMSGDAIDHGHLAHLIAERGLSESVEVDSAGTGSWHIGNPPDHRATAAAASRGVEVGGAA